ncbi:hypothetical protein Cflav_PD3950 [Pedosphaera parvula Ellin514]|uniref:Uncharacterized protein n=1 Tax=Pedosphaera parvula (strain Ellin514) TaxID=320771 RepID=B9XG71_PEDPL|nr:hypothetical protein Cflav_PD3950 [Pedosphaera parvula Ellin514]
MPYVFALKKKAKKPFNSRIQKVAEKSSATLTNRTNQFFL